ncbi:hypothetical protein WJX82_004496 [Trebouxia sp. C0006]
MCIDSLALVRGMPIVRKANEHAAFCQAEVKGPLGHLCGGVLLDTSCIKELQLSEHKAIQPGITASLPMHRDGTSSSSYITRRGSCQERSPSQPFTCS